MDAEGTGVAQFCADLIFKVVLFTPGEVAAEGYNGWLSNRTLLGRYAQELGGAMIIFERRGCVCHAPETQTDQAQ